MRIIWFNKNEVYQGTIVDHINFKHIEEINGEDSISFTTFVGVEKKDRIVFKDFDDIWREFIVMSVDETRDADSFNRPYLQVYAEASVYELFGDYIEDQSVENGSAEAALDKLLEPTRWSKGVIDDLGNANVHFYNISSREALQTLLNTWGGELQTRIEVTGSVITGRYIDIRNQIGNLVSRRFTYEKGLTEIKRIVNDEDVITALYGFGTGTTVEEGFKKYTRRLNFASINDGKAYLVNEEAKEIWGRGPAGDKRHVFGKIEFSDCEIATELKELTQEALDEKSQPNITYEATIFDLAKCDSRFDSVKLGDTVQIIDRSFSPELRLAARVIRIERDYTNIDETQILLGNFIPTLADVYVEQTQYFNQIREKESVWNNATAIPELENRIRALEEKIDE